MFAVLRTGYSIDFVHRYGPIELLFVLMYFLGVMMGGKGTYLNRFFSMVA